MTYANTKTKIPSQFLCLALIHYCSFVQIKCFYYRTAVSRSTSVIIPRYLDIEYHLSPTGTDWSYLKFEPFLTQSNSWNQQTSRSNLSSISATLSMSILIKATKHILFLLLPLSLRACTSEQTDRRSLWDVSEVWYY
jgi:hypothetical protein